MGNHPPRAPGLALRSEASIWGIKWQRILDRCLAFIPSTTIAIFSLFPLFQFLSVLYYCFLRTVKKIHLKQGVCTSYCLPPQENPFGSTVMYIERNCYSYLAANGDKTELASLFSCSTWQRRNCKNKCVGVKRGQGLGRRMHCFPHAGLLRLPRCSVRVP